MFDKLDAKVYTKSGKTPNMVVTKNKCFQR